MATPNTLVPMPPYDPYIPDDLVLIKKRMVYGTADEQWHMVGPEDRDYAHGIPLKDFFRLSHADAKQRYLGTYTLTTTGDTP